MGMKNLIDGKHLWEENICWMKTFGRGKHLGRKDLIEGKHLGEENI